ncbi:MAG TPA: hypothetical protein VND65_14980 [Candidatus Binatia bacterium]|nr:hypothetical protein [Candidatus Binatia bacterium]
MAPTTQAIVRQLTGLSRLVARRNPQTQPLIPSNGDASAYFGPGIEVAPIFGPPTEARGWQYWINQNMVFTPRPDAEFTAQALRGLAQYPLARTAIENSKDVIANLPRQIRAKKRPGEKNADVDKRSKGDATLKMLNEFFDCPDGEHDWSTWIREWLEYVFTIDAASVLIRRARSGKILEARVIDGAFITRLVDEWGYTPKPPQAAYQQLWSGTPSTVGGIPFVDLTTDQLVYRPRNIVPRNTVSSFLYGYAPTEQIAQEIQIGQERLNFVLAYYTTGTIPDAMHIVPPNISPDQLNKAQKALTSEMSGQPFKRSGFIKLIQGFVDRAQPGAASGDQLIFPKEKLLADPFDELHIRKVFYAYGASTQRIMKQMNRASAQVNQEAAEEEGTAPFAASAAQMVNWIIAKIFNLGFNSYELTFDAQKELDVVKRSTADKNDVDSGIITRDDARTARGLDPMGGDAAKLMITTATGTVPVDLDEQVQHAQNMFEAKPPPAPMGGNGKPVTKRQTPKIDPDRRTPDSRQAQARLERVLIGIFEKQREKAVVASERLLKGIRERLGKPYASAAEVPDYVPEAKRKQWMEVWNSAYERAKKKGMSDKDAEESAFAQANGVAGPNAKIFKADAPKEKADEIYRAVESEFLALPVEARVAIHQAARSGVLDGVLQIELTDAGLLSSVNEIAADYASRRAAEMVGMKWNEAGELVENPNAKWAISSTTRDRLREIVTGAFEEKTPFSEVIDDIRNADIFSDSRAAMIARTEIANAQVGSNFEVWKKSGLVAKVKWLALGPEPCPICEGNAGIVKALGDEFPSGNKYPTAHPNCFCILQAVEFTE